MIPIPSDQQNDAMKRGRFGPLLGVIHVAEKKTRFLIYAAVNAEILTIHEVANEPISLQCGWSEFDPVALFRNVCECIEVALNNLILLDIDPKDVLGLAVTNQRETCLLWDRAGQVLSNAISWNDTRTTGLVRQTLKRVKNQSSYLQEVCGLPLSTCFSAFKVKWLCESSAEINAAVLAGKCCFGTLDSWIIWNLTGGSTHVTDVTNASRTMYFNLETSAWDQRLCDFFRVNMAILPKIKSCAEVLGYVHEGLPILRGIPIYGCMTEQQGALLGQMCFQREQVVLYFAANIHLLVNTGAEVISSDHNMLSTVAFQLGPDKPLFYALEGLLPGSGGSVEWLNQLTNGGSVGCGTDTQNPMQLLTLLNSSQHSESVYCSPSPTSTLCGTPPQLSIGDQPSVATSTTQFKTAVACGPPNQLTTANCFRNKRHNIFFVPARDKVLLPGCGVAEANPNGSGLIYGVTKDTTAADLQQAAYEGICFQVKQLLQAVQKDCKSWRTIKKVTVGGELIEANARLAQTLADFCDLVVEYPQTEAVCSLGAMIAAGLAANLFTIDSIRDNMVPPATVYQRSLRLTEIEGTFRRWKALQLAIGEVSDGEHSDEEDEFRAEQELIRNSQLSEDRYKDPLYHVHRSIPGSLFATIAFATLLVAEWWQNISLN